MEGDTNFAKGKGVAVSLDLFPVPYPGGWFLVSEGRMGWEEGALGAAMLLPITR